MKIESLRFQLDALNREIAELLKQEPVSLAYQTGEAQEDLLFLYGIVGGKDVGKTSIINQLAGYRISLDTDLLDEGTKVAVAYCHQEDLPILKNRFALINNNRIRFVEHKRMELKNVVLIDFPDFDSRFQSHRDDVYQLSKHLQGILWVTTPRKYGDQDFLIQLETIAQSHENYYIVLNKFDHIQEEIPLEQARDEVMGFFINECKKRKIPLPQNDHFWIISALDPNQYEFSEFYQRLIRPHSPDEIIKAKLKNLRSEFEKNIDRINHYYQLPKRIQEIDAAVDQIQEKVMYHFSDSLLQLVLHRITLLDSLRRRISGTHFAQRVEEWPILKFLFFPLSCIVAALGGRLAFSQSITDLTESPRDLLRYEGETASMRMSSIQDEIMNQIPHLHLMVQNSSNFSKLVEEKFKSIIREYEDQVTNHLSESITSPGRFKKFLIYLPLAWFPFLQPILLRIVQMDESLFSLSSFSEILVILISVFGASSLLTSLVFLIVFYTVWLILLYAHGARMVQQKGKEEFQSIWYDTFIPWITETLNQPLVEVRSQYWNKQLQIEQISQWLQEEISQSKTG